MIGDQNENEIRRVRVSSDLGVSKFSGGSGTIRAMY
jgi:hypothetical protein